MSEIKTKPYARTVESFIAELNDGQARQSHVLIDIMSKVSHEPPVMWGASIIGFGTYRYTYASGHEGDWMRIGFSPRKKKLSLYLTQDASKYDDLRSAMGGKTSIGKGCVYVEKFDEVNLDKLTELIEAAYKDTLTMYPIK